MAEINVLVVTVVLVLKQWEVGLYVVDLDVLLEGDGLDARLDGDQKEVQIVFSVLKIEFVGKLEVECDCFQLQVAQLNS